MRKFILFLAFFLASAPAFADDSKPHAIDSVIKAQAPYGQGKLSKLFIKIYDATLWTDAKEWSMDSLFALNIKYDVEIDNDDLADRSIEEMQHVAEIPKDKIEPYRAELTKVFPNVKKGDTITALFDPKKGITFFHNDKAKSTIKDLDLAKRFISIWFAPNTTEPKLRLALLGNHG